MEPWQPLTAVRLEQKGFRGMRDVIHPAPGEEDMPMMITNMLPLDPVGGGDLVTRPPWRTMGTAPHPVNGVAQLSYVYKPLSGSTVSLLIVDGAIYSWGGSSWSVYISAAALSGASVTLSTTARCYAVTIGGNLVISDGVNTPFMYDGVTSTITKLTACPVLYGQPTVYYAKLFGIKSTERSTFVWSEENDPTIGYESGGYNNAWVLGQTGSEPLQALLGTNQGLFYWRTHSTGMIRGAVTTDFVNDGVHDGVSATVGTLTPSILLVDQRIYWVDQMGRLYCLDIGGDLVPLYLQMARKFDMTGAQFTVGWSPTSGGTPTYGDSFSFARLRASVMLIQLVYVPWLDMVMVAYPVTVGVLYQSDSGVVQAGSSSINILACYNHSARSLQAYWSWPGNGGQNVGEATYFGMLEDDVLGVASPFLYVNGSNAGTWTTPYNAFRMSPAIDSGNTDFNLDDDPVVGYPKSPPQFVIGPPQARSDDITLAFDRLDVTVGARIATANPTGGRTYEGQLGATLQTSNRQNRTELTAPLYSGDAAIFPAEGASPNAYREIRFVQNSFGLAEEGLWGRVLLRLDNSVNQGGAFVSFISGWTLTAMARTRAPASNIAPP